MNICPILGRARVTRAKESPAKSHLLLLYVSRLVPQAYGSYFVGVDPAEPVLVGLGIRRRRFPWPEAVRTLGVLLTISRSAIQM